MLVRVYTCQNVKLLEISCSGSIVIIGIFLEIRKDSRFLVEFKINKAYEDKQDNMFIIIL